MKLTVHSNKVNILHVGETLCIKVTNDRLYLSLEFTPLKASAWLPTRMTWGLQVTEAH